MAFIFEEMSKSKRPLGFPLVLCILYDVLIVCVPFPCGVWGSMWNSIVSVPDHCLFIHFQRKPFYAFSKYIGTEFDDVRGAEALNTHNDKSDRCFRGFRLQRRYGVSRNLGQKGSLYPYLRKETRHLSIITVRKHS